MRVEIHKTSTDLDHSLTEIAEHLGGELNGLAKTLQRQGRPVPRIDVAGFVAARQLLTTASGNGDGSEYSNEDWTYPIRAYHHIVTLGPLCPPAGRPCPKCLELRWQSLRNTAEQGALADGKPLEVVGRNPRLTPFALEVIVGALRKHLTGMGGEEERQAHAFFMVNLQRLYVSSYRLIPDSLCPRCSPLPEDSADLVPSELKPREKRSPRNFRLRHVRDYPFPRDAYINPAAGLLGRHALQGFDNTISAPVSGSFWIKSKWTYHESWWSGQGTSFANSTRLGFLEGLERHAGLRMRSKKVSVHDTYDRLRDSQSAEVLDPRTTGLYVDRFYEVNKPVYLPFATDREYYWVWGYSVTRNEPVLIPQQLVYYLDYLPDHANFVQDCSNGCAIGSCLEEAMLHGLFELIERDSFLITWFAKLGLPRIDPWSSTSPEILFMADRVGRLGYDLHLFDMRLDFKVPSVMGLCIRREDGLGKAVVAAGASLDPEAAVLGALSEVASYIPGFKERVEGEIDHVRQMYEDHSKVEGLSHHALLFGLPEMLPELEFLFDGSEPRSIEEVYGEWNEEYRPSLDLKQDLEVCFEQIHDLGLEVLLVDQTTPEQAGVGLSTACVIVPGLMPMDFGYYRQRIHDLPRLRTVPRSTGHRSRDLEPSEINPTPHPFP